MLQLKNSLVVCAIVLGTALGLQANMVPVDPAPPPGPCAAAGKTFDKLEHAGSCTIGDKTFSNFTLTPTVAGGATAVTANKLDYSTIDKGAAAIGFSFSGAINAAGGSHGHPPTQTTQTNKVVIGFTVTGPGPDIKDASLALTGMTTGTGTASVVETIHPAGGSAQTLTVGVPGSHSVGFTFSPPVGSVVVSKTALASATGVGNSASISTFTETFSQVPEPSTMLLFGSGLLLLVLIVSRKQLRTDQTA